MLTLIVTSHLLLSLRSASIHIILVPNKGLHSKLRAVLTLRMCRGIVSVRVGVCMFVFLFSIPLSTSNPYFLSFYLVTNEIPIRVQRKEISFKYRNFGACLSASLLSHWEKTVCFIIYCVGGFKQYCLAAGMEDRLQHLWLLGLIDCEITSLVVMW